MHRFSFVKCVTALVALKNLSNFPVWPIKNILLFEQAKWTNMHLHWKIHNSESERDSLYERILFINKQNELEHVVCELESSNQ